MAAAVGSKPAAFTQEEQLQLQRDSAVETKIQHLFPYAQTLLQVDTLSSQTLQQLFYSTLQLKAWLISRGDRVSQCKSS